MIRYTLLRLLIFLGCLVAFWLLGLRSQEQQPYLLIAAAVSSVVLSFFLLRRERTQFSERIAERIERRAQARQALGGIDEEAEDAELDDDADPSGDQDQRRDHTGRE